MVGLFLAVPVAAFLPAVWGAAASVLNEGPEQGSVRAHGRATGARMARPPRPVELAVAHRARTGLARDRGRGHGPPGRRSDDRRHHPGGDPAAGRQDPHAPRLEPGTGVDRGGGRRLGRGGRLHRPVGHRPREAGHGHRHHEHDGLVGPGRASIGRPRSRAGFGRRHPGDDPGRADRVDGIVRRARAVRGPVVLRPARRLARLGDGSPGACRAGATTSSTVLARAPSRSWAAT